MHESNRIRGLATALVVSTCVGVSSLAGAVETPRVPQPLVLTLELERAEAPSLSEPLVLTLNLEREESRSESEPTASSGEVSWERSGDVSSQDYDDCLAKATEFNKRCDEIARRWATQDCERSKHQSNCANWKVSCFSPYTPGWVFSESNCSRPGFYQCASATYPGYVGCVEGCNTAKDRGACLHERCQTQAKTSLGHCGDGQTTGNAWREPSGGSPEARPGSDPDVMAASAVAAGVGAVEGAAAVAGGAGPPLAGGGTVRGGRVAVRRDGREKTLSRGETFESGEQIMSSEPCSLMLPDGTQISLGPRARMSYDKEIHEAVVHAGKALFDHALDVAAFEAWKVARARARTGWESLEVVTSGVRAVLLGTSFLVDTDPESRIDRVLVHSGALDVEGLVSGRAQVGAGQMAMARNGVLGRASPLSEAEWAAEKVGVEEGDSVVAGNPVSGSIPAAKGRVDTVECSGVLGAWRWFNGVMVECYAEGRCEASNGFGGPWACLDPSGSVEIRWSRAGQQTPYVDTLSLSSDGWELRGVNQSGQGVGGQRPEFSGGEPQAGCQAIVGNWRWSGGATVECRPTKTCVASNGMSGPWRCVNDRGRFEIRWTRDGRPDQQFIDTLLVSPLGTYLTGKNQHGVGIGALRE